MKLASPICRALFGAAFIIAASAMLAWLPPAVIDPDMRHRLLGVLLGAVVVVYANAIPKAALAHARMRTRTRCTPAMDQAARRFVGWVLVVGGIGYMAASLLAPIGVSGMAAGLALGTAVTVMALGLRRMARPRA